MSWEREKKTKAIIANKLLYACERPQPIDVGMKHNDYNNSNNNENNN